MTEEHPFKWRHFQAEIILLCVHWYLRYALSYRDLEEIMLERGLYIDHTTIFRWVQAYAPEREKCCRPYLKACTERDAEAAKCFFVKALGASVSRAGMVEEKTMQPDTKGRRAVPRVINVDKNMAYPKAIAELKASGIFPESRKPGQMVKPGMGFFSETK